MEAQLAPPTDDNLIVCLAEGEAARWKNDLPGLYKDSDVIRANGDEAKSLLNTQGDGEFVPILAVAYHPQCPHCHGMVNDYKQLGLSTRDAGPLELLALGHVVHVPVRVLGRILRDDERLAVGVRRHGARDALAAQLHDLLLQPVALGRLDEDRGRRAAARRLGQKTDDALVDRGLCGTVLSGR